MSTYDDTLLAARFATLAPEPLPADWGDVLDRAGTTRRGRRPATRTRELDDQRRRRLVALGVAVLLVALGTATAYGIRAFFLDRGFVGLPPVGATPSAPERGRLVIAFNGRSAALESRLNQVWIYADGRMIWRREGAVAAGANEVTSGFLEQRLTPAGVERLVSELLATGLFDRDRRLLSAHSAWGEVWARRDSALVRVGWADVRSVGQARTRDHTAATREQEGALERVDALLADPASRLPASAWADRRIKAYVASRYAICSGQTNPRLGRGAPTIDSSRILELLPPSLAHQIHATGWMGRNWNGACSVVTTEEARAVTSALEGAVPEWRGRREGRGAESPYRVAYSFEAIGRQPGRITIYLEPALPHGEWICTPCG